MTTACRILVIGPAWVGDMVMAQSLFKRLKTRAPVELHVMAPKWTFPLLERMPEVDQALELPFKHGQLALSQRIRLGRSLKASHYDQAIVIPNSWKAAVLPFAAGIPKRTGWLGEWRYGLLNDARRLDKTAYPKMVQRLVALGCDRGDGQLPDELPKPAMQALPHLLAKTAERFDIQSDRPAIALCPGAEYGPSKRWPEPYFAKLAESLHGRGYDVWLLGSPGDQAVTQSIQQASWAPVSNFAGETTLSEAIDLLTLSQRVVSNDSGLMHIAAALKKPMVAIFGSSSKRFTPPLAVQATIIDLDLDCSPCFERHCPLGHHQCMRGISDKQVEAALFASTAPSQASNLGV